MEGMRCAVSGSGNVAEYASQKLMELGATVVTMSDSNGVLVFDDGMTKKDWNIIVDCKQVNRGRLSSLDGKVSGRYVANESPWSIDVKYDLALPCATQNELDEDGVARLIKNGVLGIFEGANLPTHTKGQDLIREKGDVIYVPGKASNAGGVGVSGLEMSQNAQHLTWTEEEVDEKLQNMMEDIYKQMQDAGKDDSLEAGANRAGFLKVATAMKQLGYIW
jgi:glutamate dehydrogenase (NADP+)